MYIDVHCHLTGDEYDGGAPAVIARANADGVGVIVASGFDLESSAQSANIAEKHDGETVLVVSHGGTIRAMICALLGYPIKELSRVSPVGNASITVVEYENGQARFILTGERSHLPEHLK